MNYQAMPSGMRLARRASARPLAGSTLGLPVPMVPGAASTKFHKTASRIRQRLGTKPEGVRAPYQPLPPRAAASITEPSTDVQLQEAKPTPQELCSLLARRRLAAWLRLAEEDSSSFQEELITIPDSAVTVVAAKVRFSPPDSPPQALVSIAALAKPAALGSPEHAEVGLAVHWGCAKRETGSWKAPPAGWTTLPDHSVDASWGAWQTPMNAAKLADGSLAYVMALQISLDGPLKRPGSGIPFVLHSSTGLWINRGGPGANFFIGLHEAPDIDAPQLAPPSASPTPAPTQPQPEATNGRQPTAPPTAPASPTTSAASTSAQMAAAAAAAGAEAGAQAAVEAGAKAGPSAELKEFLRTFVRKDWGWDDFLPEDFAPAARRQQAGAMEPAKWMIDRIKGVEGQAERSLMHRFKIAHDLVGDALQCPAPGPALVAVATWLRLSAMRLLTWNRNYNVKPREISTAQDTLAQRLASVADTIRSPEARDVMIMAMAAVGRGGASDVGQRVRDEILSVQSRNNAKGGMMEEWHQKLHNNTSPDDVVICEALLAFVKSDCDISEYWRVLNSSGITRERLRSYDRPIVSEPSFGRSQLAGLEVDLTSYLGTLRAVHTGADLSSAAGAVLGYRETSMKGKAIDVPPVEGVATERLRLLVEAVLHLQQEAQGSLQGATRLLGMAVEARRELFRALSDRSVRRSNRLKDVMFLDLALESVGRTAVEASLAEARKLPAERGLAPLMALLLPACEAAVLSSRGSPELAVCWKALYDAGVGIRDGTPDGVPKALAALERLKRVVADGAARVGAMLQPTAEALCWQLGISGPAVEGFSEEVVRCGAAAPLAQLAAVVEPRLREAAQASCWQVISRGNMTATGVLLVVDSLSAVPEQGYTGVPVVLLLMGAIRGEEEVPAGVVGVVAAEVPDVLSHAAVRARNTKTMLLGCPDAEILKRTEALTGHIVKLEIVREDVVLSDLGPVAEAGWQLRQDGEGGAGQLQPLLGAEAREALKVAPWCGRYAVRAEEFKPGLVGNKSLHTARLYGRLARWVHQPASVAVPFGVPEAVVEHPENRDARAQLAMLTARAEEESGLSRVELRAARDIMAHLACPPELRQQLQAAFAKARLPTVDRESAWDACWGALRGVWASTWNDRADTALRKAGLPRSLLRMSVLCQDVVPFTYAFVAHSKNPVNDDAGEVFVEVVEGLGEVLVGSYPGRGLSAVVNKAALEADARLLRDGDTSGVGAGAVRVVGYPSKTTALFLPPSSLLQHGWKSSAVIFRSDSNAEDLSGFAGAGLFDSHMTVPLRAVVAGSGPTCPLSSDREFQRTLLLRAAAVAVLAEQRFGGPQDVEGGVLEDGAMFIVQSRPQV